MRILHYAYHDGSVHFSLEYKATFGQHKESFGNTIL